jgi:starch synthase
MTRTTKTPGSPTPRTSRRKTEVPEAASLTRGGEVSPPAPPAPPAQATNEAAQAGKTTAPSAKTAAAPLPSRRAPRGKAATPQAPATAAPVTAPVPKGTARKASTSPGRARTSTPRRAAVHAPGAVDAPVVPAGIAASSAGGDAPLRIVMVSSELEPFSKTGGLADVASALPRALGRLGHDVTVITPRYRGIDAGEHHGAVAAQVGGHWFECGLYEHPLGPNARALFVDVPSLYHREGLYNAHNVDFPDNALRFAVLNLAALEWAGRQPQAPSLIHAHDWQAGLAPVYLRSHFSQHPRLAGLPSVFTIHNLAYQGIFEKEWMPQLGLGWDIFTVRGLEFWDRISFLKAGVNFADAVTTVSPRYAQEIQTAEFGYGFDGVMRDRRDALSGILNGIDVERWNPAADPHLPAPYSADDLAGKRAAKRALLEKFGLAADAAALERPVIGMITRLVDQKGQDLVAAVAGELMELGATFMVLGSGETRYQEMWSHLRHQFPDRIGMYIGFHDELAHLIEGGSDLFLMPSRYEPCGLNQMYSLRYGTVPVVRQTGGLADSVQPWVAETGEGTGFLFHDYHPSALLDAVRRALAAYRDRDGWRRLQANGMRQDFSWHRSAARYVEVYKGVIAARQPSVAAATDSPA